MSGRSWSRSCSRGSRVAVLAAAAMLAAGCDSGPAARPTTVTTLSPVSVPTTTTTTTPSQPALTALPKTFDETAVQDAVHKVLVESYQITDLGVVICPAHQRVRARTTFFCTTTVDGASKMVRIKVLDAEGRYSVGMPE